MIDFETFIEMTTNPEIRRLKQKISSPPKTPSVEITSVKRKLTRSPSLT